MLAETISLQNIVTTSYSHIDYKEHLPIEASIQIAASEKEHESKGKEPEDEVTPKKESKSAAGAKEEKPSNRLEVNY